MNTKTSYLALGAILSLLATACGGEATTNNGQVVIINESDAGAGADADAGGGEGYVTDYVFEGEEVACAANPAFEEAAAVLGGGKINPTGRGEQGSVYDPCHGRVILFGGNDKQPAQCNSFGDKNYIGDTWAYSLEHSNWYRVRVDDAPSARGRHGYAFDLSRKQLFIFGGRYRDPSESGNYQTFNEMWSFDVNKDEWTQVAQKGDIPSARFNTAMAYDEANDRIVLFGGNSNPNGLNLTPLRDTFVFDIATSTWERVDTAGEAPEARLYHAMAYDSSQGQMLIFGGGAEDAFFGAFYSDVWALDMANLTWERRWVATESIGPRGRINPGWMADPERGRVLLFGGHDDTALGNANDLWSFDLGTNEWAQLRAGDVHTGEGCNSFCSCPETFVTYDEASPERRQYPTFVPTAGGEALLFGGTGDCGYMDDTWTLDVAASTWTEEHAAEQGIACARTGREDCEELCY